MLLRQGAQKCHCFWFIHILSYRFNPIRSQLETVLNFWLVNVCMKKCELIKGGHTFGLLAVTCYSIYTNFTIWFIFLYHNTADWLSVRSVRLLPWYIKFLGCLIFRIVDFLYFRETMSSCWEYIFTIFRCSRLNGFMSDCYRNTGKTS